MKDIRTQITINATPEKVWEVLVDFPAYGEWNPFITSIKGGLEEGSILSVTMVLEGGKPQNFTPDVLSVKTAREFRWEGSLIAPWVFRGEHFFVLWPKEDGTTVLEHGEHFSGVLVPVLSSMLKKTAIAFVEMNNELKVRVEARNPKISLELPQQDKR